MAYFTRYQKEKKENEITAGWIENVSFKKIPNGIQVDWKHGAPTTNLRASSSWRVVFVLKLKLEETNGNGEPVWKTLYSGMTAKCTFHEMYIKKAFKIKTQDSEFVKYSFELYPVYKNSSGRSSYFDLALDE